MTPARTVVRSAAGHRPDQRQPLLIELVRRRDAAATSRLLQAWVHRRGLASLEAFRRSVSPGLLSAADDAWLERCLHEPLVPQLGSAKAPASPFAEEEPEVVAADPTVVIDRPSSIATAASSRGNAARAEEWEVRVEPETLALEPPPIARVAAEAPLGLRPAATASPAGHPAALDSLAGVASQAPRAFSDLEVPGLAADPWTDASLSPCVDGEPGLPPELSAEGTEPWMSAPQAAWNPGVGNGPPGVAEVQQTPLAGQGAERGGSPAGSLLSEAPGRLRRKLVGSMGRARRLMRACLEEAISTLHAQADPDSEQDRDLIALVPDATTPERGAPSWSGPASLPSPAASVESASLAPPVPRAAAAPASLLLPAAAPAAAWTASLGRTLSGGASPDRSLQGSPAPAPEALADLRAWLPGAVAQTRRAS